MSFFAIIHTSILEIITIYGISYHCKYSAVEIVAVGILVYRYGIVYSDMGFASLA